MEWVIGTFLQNFKKLVVLLDRAKPLNREHKDFILVFKVCGGGTTSSVSVSNLFPLTIFVILGSGKTPHGFAVE